MTVVFIDIVGSTEKAVEFGDSGWMEFLGEFQRFVRAELRRFKGREIDTAGDGFFATFDVPARAVRCAMGIAEHIRSLGIEIRAGCHTGEVEFAKDGVRGVAVVIGARIGALARPGEVVCSSTPSRTSPWAAACASKTWACAPSKASPTSGISTR